MIIFDPDTDQIMLAPLNEGFGRKSRLLVLVEEKGKPARKVTKASILFAKVNVLQIIIYSSGDFDLVTE